MWPLGFELPVPSSEVVRRPYASSGSRRAFPTGLDVSNRRVDVVVPCYNYAHFLPGCLRSILSQEGVQVRLLVIDDCSTDNTFDTARHFAHLDPRVQVRRHEVNLGHIATYNEGLFDWAEGDYSVLISADDLLAPGSLRRAVQVMESEPSIGVVYGPAPYFRSNDRLTIGEREPRLYSRWDGADWIRDRCRNAYNVISSPEVVTRMSVQRKAGPYREDLPHAGDFEMWLRMAALSDVAYVRGTPQAYYRVHESSMQNTSYSGFSTDLWQRRAVFECFFSDHARALPGGSQMHANANRALARQALWHAVRAYDRDDIQRIPIDRLVGFALETTPNATSTSEFGALLRRRKLGATFCHRTQAFALSAAWRRLITVARFQRWKRRGV